jgi:hypothetical protein
MKRLKITRLKLTAEAAAQLDALGLSPADMSLVLCFASRAGQTEARIYRFDIERVPAEIRDQLRHLVGVELQVVLRSIVSATRTVSVARS